MSDGYRRIRIRMFGRVHIRQQGLPALLEKGSQSPSYREALPSCVYHREITRPGILFDPDVHDRLRYGS